MEMICTLSSAHCYDNDHKLASLAQRADMHATGNVQDRDDRVYRTACVNTTNTLLSLLHVVASPQNRGGEIRVGGGVGAGGGRVGGGEGS